MSIRTRLYQYSIPLAMIGESVKQYFTINVNPETTLSVSNSQSSSIFQEIDSERFSFANQEIITLTL